MNRIYGSLQRKALCLCLLSLYLLPVNIGMAKSLTLQEAVEQALKNGSDLKVAVKEEEKAKAALAGAKGALDPTLSLRSGVTFQSAASRDSSTSNSNSLQLSLPLYTGGRLENTVGKAQDAVTAAALDLQRTAQDTKLKVVSAYYQVLQAKSLLAVNEETVKNDQEHLRNVKALYEAGSIAKADVLRSEVELANAEQARLKQQNTYALAVSSLKNIIKDKSKEEVTLVDSLQYTPVTASLEECLAQGGEKRPDIVIEKINRDKAVKDIAIAKSDKLPSVSLSASTGWDDAALPTHDNYTSSVGVSASWNLFDGKVADNKRKQAEISLEQAEIKLAEKQDAVAEEIRQPYLSMREAEQRLQTTQVAIAKAEEDYFIAKEKYKTGEGIILDILDAQLALATAKNNYINAQYDYAVNKAKLENAMGLD